MRVQMLFYALASVTSQRLGWMVGLMRRQSASADLERQALSRQDPEEAPLNMTTEASAGPQLVFFTQVNKAQCNASMPSRCCFAVVYQPYGQ